MSMILSISGYPFRSLSEIQLYLLPVEMPRTVDSNATVKWGVTGPSTELPVEQQNSHNLSFAKIKELTKIIS